MQAQDGRTYAQIVHGKVHWLFTKAELPEWNDEMCPAVDVTDLTPCPEVGWGYNGVTFTLPAAPASPTVDELCAKIDAEADAARLKIAGDPLRMVEYERADAEAKAFAAVGYTGDVPLSVADWAEAKGWTAQEATDDILRASAAWNAALYAIRGIRLKGKEAVRNALEADRQETANVAIEQINLILTQVV